MSRVVLSGDLHGHIDIWKLNSEHFPEGNNLTKDDYVIILGDFGLVWDNDKQEPYWRKWLNNKPWTTLFVDGNHDHIPFINQFPIEEWNGGKIHRISDSIYHLMRGEVYTIDKNKYLCMGGATSYDKYLRTKGINWWEEELPNRYELENLMSNVMKHKYHIDYVLTHTCPTDIRVSMGYINSKFMDTDINYYCRLEDFFNSLYKDLVFKKWYFGHYHIDMDLTDKFRCIYDDKIEIGIYD